MTNTDFATFIDKLFIAFPSLHEWLQATYKPEETQRLWRQTLAAYTLAEALSVIDRWTRGALKPFAAYERDQVHLMIRSIIEMDRDRQRKKQEQSAGNQAYYRKIARRGEGESIGLGSAFDCDMVAAVKEGAIENKRMLDGEITQDEYERCKQRIMDKYGI